ncbi:MAG TPA: ABC transporter [Rhodospirillaceae bacterium]|nr:MAG: ABC transporter [Alphaproteobacteria bacterium GWF2_58_20]HAU29743.1 ABC transporter [Rhodospirillaceae bacterium]
MIRHLITAFSPNRIWAMVLRYWYLIRSSLPRMIELVYWPFMQMLIWGFMSQFLRGHDSFMAKASSTLLAAVMLWDLLYRSQIGMSVSFLEEVWSRNLAQIFISPLRPFEWLISLMITSLIRTLISAIPIFLLAALFFGFRVWDLGWPVLAFWVNLTLMAWSISLLNIGIILRAGQGAESLTWALTFMIVPISAIYYPVSTLPYWLHPLAWSLPSTHVFEGLRALMFDGVFRTDLAISALLLNVLYMVLGFVFFFWCFAAARRNGQLFRQGE